MIGWLSSAWLWASGWLLGYAAAKGATTISVVVAAFWVVGCLWVSMDTLRDHRRR